MAFIWEWIKITKTIYITNKFPIETIAKISLYLHSENILVIVLRINLAAK